MSTIYSSVKLIVWMVATKHKLEAFI